MTEMDWMDWIQPAIGEYQNWDQRPIGINWNWLGGAGAPGSDQIEPDVLIMIQ